MADSVLLLAVIALSYAAFVCLALSQAKPWRAVAIGDQRSPRKHALRAVGFALLAATLLLTLVREGIAFGMLLWPLILAVAATAVAFTLTWRPHWLRGVARIGAEQGVE